MEWYAALIKLIDHERNGAVKAKFTIIAISAATPASQVAQYCPKVFTNCYRLITPSTAVVTSFSHIKPESFSANQEAEHNHFLE